MTVLVQGSYLESYREPFVCIRMIDTGDKEPPVNVPLHNPAKLLMWETLPLNDDLGQDKS